MTENKNPHHHRGGNSFILGVIVGALLATMLTTKKGRQILRDLTNLGLEILEEFIEDHSQEKKIKTAATVSVKNADLDDASDDLQAEITELESVAEPQASEVKAEDAIEAQDEPVIKNGHSKKRLFRGIRRK